MKLINDEKHYNTLSNYYKAKYQKKVFKVSLNAGFTCPNKDGKVGFGGCTYCSKLGSGDFAGNPDKSLTEQFFEIKDMMNKKWPDAYYIAYLQANTNTYAPLDRLKRIYEEAIKIDPGIIGLSISTRPDEITDELILYLEELNKKTEVSIELGLQSIYPETAKKINRCHSLECFDNAVKKLRKSHIEVIVHIINGLPFETHDMMVNTVKHLNNLDIQGIKIHMLHIMKDTQIYIDYEKEKFPILSLEEYRDIVIDQIRHLNKNIIIHRLTGDAPKELLIAPLWTLKKFVVMNEIDKKMREINAYQGDLL